MQLKHIFFVFLIYGVLLSFLVPPLQSPDEASHIWSVYDSVGGGYEGYGFVAGADQRLYQMTTDPSIKIDKSLKESLLNEKPIELVQGNFIHGIRPSAVKYLPQIMGAWLASVLDLPVFYIYTFAELFGVLFYSLVCTQALFIMPYRRELMLVLMLFPMALHQAGSFSYDCTLISVSFLYVACVFRIIYNEKRSVRDIAVALLLLLWISYIKPPYMLLGLMFLIIMTKKQRVISVIGGIAIVAAVMVLGIKNYWVQVMWQCALHPVHTLSIYGITIAKTFNKWMKEAFGVFGWMDFGIPDAVVTISFVLFFALAILPDEDKLTGHVINVPEALWGGFVFTFTTFAVLTAMMNHTIRMDLFGSEWTTDTYDLAEEFRKLKMVHGVQGRYFLPIVILPMMAFLPCSQAIYPKLGLAIDSVVKRTKKSRVTLVVAYNIFIAILTVCIMIKRYWM